MKCLEKDPDDRYMEAHSLVKALLEVTDALLAKMDRMGQAESKRRAGLGFNKAHCGQIPYFTSSLTKVATDDITQVVLKRFNDQLDRLRYIFVKGESGVGKTTLLDEIETAVISKYNFVIPWNYNCTDMNVTKYSSAMWGLQTICTQIQ